jgi:uncharacterized protein YdaU (DUF1376 family)
MPTYGNDLFAAVEGYPDNIGMSYIRALWHYWHHTHCQGLPDDDDYLRRVCRQDLTNWYRVKGIVFNEFFKLNGDGKWHQDRCRELYAEATDVYTRRVARAANARANITTDTSPDINTEESTGFKTQPKPKPKPDLKPEPEPKPEPLCLAAQEAQPQQKPGCCDDTFLNLLQADATYSRINIRECYGAMLTWCRINRKYPTRRRFVNWINRALNDAPMTAKAGKQESQCTQVKLKPL